jgi:hypothetical protein
MTIEQITKITRDACAQSNVVPYGAPVLNGDTWTIGFDPRDNTIALQTYFQDRDITTPLEELRAINELSQRIGTAIMMSR